MKKLLSQIGDRLLALTLRLLPVPCVFSATDMNRIHAGTVTLWLYKSTADAIAAIIASGYFNDYVDELRQGDIIIAVDVGTSVDVLTVSSANNATPVTVVNGT